MRELLIGALFGVEVGVSVLAWPRQVVDGEPPSERYGRMGLAVFWAGIGIAGLVVLARLDPIALDAVVMLWIAAVLGFITLHWLVRGRELSGHDHGCRLAGRRPLHWGWVLAAWFVGSVLVLKLVDQPMSGWAVNRGMDAGVTATCVGISWLVLGAGAGLFLAFAQARRRRRHGALSEAARRAGPSRGDL